MKLLYKHDNEVIDVVFEDCDGNLRVINKNDTSKEGEYGSIKAFLKDFEDVPAEPLIKDEKVRKAVRAWAEACRLKYATYKQSSNEFYDPDTRGKFAIKFTLKPIEVWLDDGKCYTIAELCGEEE